MPATIVQLSPSKRGTSETLAAMMLLATDPRTTPRIRFEALKLVGHLPTPEARTRALFRWVRATCAYVADPPVFEHIQRPWSLPGDEFPGTFELALARSPAAAFDCDDHSVLMAALCHALGQDVRLVVTETYESSPEWEHVHAETNIAGPYEPERWVAVDTSLSWLEFGETHKGVSAEAVYSSDLDALGAHERLALGQAAEGGGGAWDLLRGAIEFGGQLIRGAMTQRGLDRQAAAIREAGQLQSETQRLIGERRAELQAAYGALNAEREGFWGAREEAQRRLFWERLKGPAGAGLALAGLVAVGWATARRSRPRRRNGRRRQHGSQVSGSRRR